MKEFILVVRVPITYTAENAKEVNPQWNKVIEQWKADKVFVTSFAFPGDSYVVSGVDKTVKKEPVIAENRTVVSSIVLLAASFEDAIALAKNCPVLQYDGTVEVREIRQRLVTDEN